MNKEKSICILLGSRAQWKGGSGVERINYLRSGVDGKEGEMLEVEWIVKGEESKGV